MIKKRSKVKAKSILDYIVFFEMIYHRYPSIKEVGGQFEQSYDCMAKRLKRMRNDGQIEYKCPEILSTKHIQIDAVTISNKTEEVGVNWLTKSIRVAA